MSAHPFPLRGGLIAIIIILASVVSISPTMAQQGTCGTAAGYFQIDGQFYSEGSLIDWAQGLAGQSVFDGSGTPLLVPALYDRDPHWAGNAVDPDAFSGSGNKNNDDISAGMDPWSWGAGSGPAKNDLTDVLAHSAIVNNDVWLFLSAMTRSNNGSSHVDFEFNQQGFTQLGSESGTIVGNGTEAGRTANTDFIVSVDYEGGGTIPVVSFRTWQSSGSGYEFLPVIADPNEVFVCTNDQVIPAPPWGAISTNGDEVNTVDTFQMVEIALNLTGLGIDPSVFCTDNSTLLFKTRSSASFTAELKDLALHPFSIYPTPDCTISADQNPLCEGQTTMLCAPTPPVGANYTYAWSGPGGPYPNAQCITTGLGGTYTLVITDNDTGCDSGPCTIDLVVNPLPSCAISIDTDTVCEGETASFCGPVAPGGMTYSYQWSGPAGPYPDARCIDVGMAGTYSLVVTNVTTGCMSGSCSQDLFVNPLPDFEIAGPNLICPDTTAQLCGPEGDYAYAWGGPGGSLGGDRCVVTGTAGVYSLTVTDATTGCQSVDGHVLVVAENPGCTVEGPDSICPGETIVLCGPEGEGFVYSWVGSGGFSESTRCVDVTEAGTYTLTVSDGNGCESVCEKIVTLDENVSARGLEDLWLCTGEQAEFCIEATGTGPITYQWYKDGQEISGATEDCYTIPSITAGDVGKYEVLVTGKCSSVKRGADLTLADVEVEAFHGLYLCAGQRAEICPQVSGKGPFTFEWTKDGTPVGTDSCLIIEEVTEADEGEYCLRVEGACGDPVVQCATLLVGDCVEYCGLTQGFYGNYGGKWNGMTTLELLDLLITEGNPLVVGVPGTRSVTWPEGSERCIIDRLPGGGRSAPLPADLGDVVVSIETCMTDPKTQNSPGRYKNTLFAQTITLSLNVRLDPNLPDLPLCEVIIMIGVLPGPDGLYGTEDDIPNNDDVRIVEISPEVFIALDALGLSHTAGGLLELSNRALAEDLLPSVNVSPGELAGALGAVNDVVDECALTIHCESALPLLADKENPDNLRTIHDGIGPTSAPTFGIALRSSNPIRMGSGLRVQFQLPEESAVRIAVYDIAGRVVGNRVDGNFSPGEHDMKLDLRSRGRVSGGIYFLKMDARGLSTGERFSRSTKIVLMP